MVVGWGLEEEKKCSVVNLRTTTITLAFSLLPAGKQSLLYRSMAYAEGLTLLRATTLTTAH